MKCLGSTWNGVSVCSKTNFDCQSLEITLENSILSRDKNTPRFLEYFGNLAQEFLRPLRHFESGVGPGDEVASSPTHMHLLCLPLNHQGSNRRWSSIQAQEFTHLYSVLATLVCSCDVSSQITVGKKDTPI